MLKIIYVGVGGFIGAILRYLIGGWVHKLLNEPWLPVGTFVVNMLGCLLIGVLMGLVETRQFVRPEMRLLLITGLLGSLTTFSTFAFESISLFRNGESVAAMMNVGGQLFIGLIAVFLGMALAKAI
jgi:fluoride exporter